jgi:hypothetical protein
MFEVCEPFHAADDLETQKIFADLPKLLGELSDPKSPKIRTFANLVSSVSGLADNSLDVTNVQLVCRTIETGGRVHDGELSPLQGGIVIGARACQVLSLAVGHHGYYKTAKGLEVAGILLTMADCSRWFITPEAKPNARSAGSSARPGKSKRDG